MPAGNRTAFFLFVVLLAAASFGMGDNRGYDSVAISLGDDYGVSGASSSLPKCVRADDTPSLESRIKASERLSRDGQFSSR